ncbi:MAG TPA: hypothetical protein VD908_16465 [Cytophagales bacterium]|nr:hypothetical protein [Cytophagales bacterium]
MSKKLLAFLLLITSILFSITSCKEDEGEGTPERPSFTLPGSATAQVGQQIEIQVAEINATGNIASVTATTTSGTVDEVVVTGQGAASGSAVIKFTAPETAGTSTITVVVTDGQNPAKSDQKAIAVTVTEDPIAPTKDIFFSAEGTGTRTFYKDTVYRLNGFIFVNDGQTLTIEAGTIIKGEPGQGTAASALIVARGGKIMAEGTAEAPIIFTALEDDIQPGQKKGTTLAANRRGLWGGLILLGKAPINHASAEVSIEGIPSTETRGIYGGTDPADNSGVLKYISIRHGGTNIGAGNEINGLTMGGVGSGTSISYIEVFGNDDDGFEWFGGNANTSYLASVYNQDDSYDWDFGWRGQNQFWVAYQEPGFEGSGSGFESDGAHSGNYTAAVFSKPQIFNLTSIGQENGGTTSNRAMFFTEGSGGLINNSIVMNFASGVELTDVGATGMNSRDRLASGDLAFKNNIFFKIGDNSMATVSHGLAALETHLTANANVLGDPQLAAASGTAKINLLPVADGAAFTTPRAALPAADNGFTYETADFIGAFGTNNWMKGWTAADAYGLLD